MKLWFDEDLSPTLVQVATARGFEATCNHDRGLLGATDAELRRVAQGEGFVLVTDNASDFRPMFARDEIHPGLAVMPAEHGRAGQQRLAGARIDFIIAAADAAHESPEDFMVNRLVEIDEHGGASARELPPAYAGQRRLLAARHSHELAGDGRHAIRSLVVLLLDHEPTPDEVRRIQAQENQREDDAEV